MFEAILVFQIIPTQLSDIVDNQHFRPLFDNIGYILRVQSVKLG